jgi:Protein of unknown function (DUF1203)
MRRAAPNAQCGLRMAPIHRMDGAAAAACRRNRRKAPMRRLRQDAGPQGRRAAMARFRCIPIATETAERFRRTGTDDRGQALHRRVAGGDGPPCRHCLQPVAAGEAMLLGSYDLPAPRGVYWTPSPIFLHAGPCPRYRDGDGIAPIIRGRLVSVRAYDAEEMCLYDLGEVCEGEVVEAPLLRALEDPRTRFVNIHTARPGCLLCRVERG